MFSNFEFKEMAMQDYHEHPAYNMSALNEAYDRSIAHMVHKRMNPDKPTEAQRIGTLFHTALLEPEQYSPVLLPSGDRRTTEWKQRVLEMYPVLASGVTKSANEILAELGRVFAGKQFISEEHATMINNMITAIQKDTSVYNVFSQKTWAEKAIFCTHDETGVKVKVRPDFYTDKFGGIAIDVKTTEDASENGFRGSIYKYRYYRSYALYTDVLKASGLKISKYMLFAIEKEAPHGFSMWTMNEDLLLRGRKDYTEALRRVAEYEKTGVATGYRNAEGKLTFECV